MTKATTTQTVTDLSNKVKKIINSAKGNEIAKKLSKKVQSSMKKDDQTVSKESAIIEFVPGATLSEMEKEKLDLSINNEIQIIPTEVKGAPSISSKFVSIIELNSSSNANQRVTCSKSLGAEKFRREVFESFIISKI